MKILKLIKYINFSNKQAFSLSEILIALSIIGILASVTIPSLIKNVEKEKTIVKLKNTYLEINEAIKLSEIEKGDMSKWDRNIVISKYFDYYIAPYLKILSTEISTIQNNSYKKISNGYESNNTGLIVLRPSKKIKKYNLQSGAQVFVSDSMNESVTIFIDINGNSQPNQFGKDVFMYRIYHTIDTKGIKLVPFGYINTSEFTVVPAQMQPSRKFLKTGSNALNYGCNKQNGRGMFCSALIMRDNWKIKSDYPW